MKNLKFLKEELVSYAHIEDPNGPRFCQYKKDKLPTWAVDVQPYVEPTCKAYNLSETHAKIAW